MADNTGCADLAMDPKDPKVVYASMWQFRRLPWFFTSGGPKSGLFKSADGGVTWKPIRKGLPEGDLGRIAVAVAASKPNVVYANVEAKRTALYKSEDHGDSWTEVSASSATTSRPFYYSLLVIDPTNPDRVYKPATLLGISEDGGKTFSGGGLMGGSFHPDLHALWVNPKNPEEILLFLSRVPLFQTLPRSALDEIVRDVHVESYPKGTLLIRPRYSPGRTSE